VLVFGLAWRVFTEAQVTYHSSKRYPQSTRVLLFLANTLFATTGVAFVTLTRGLGTDADPSLWGTLGDSTLGEPLYLTGLIAGLWLVLRPPLTTSGPVVPADPGPARRGTVPFPFAVPPEQGTVPSSAAHASSTARSEAEATDGNDQGQEP
jgi:hypothetical protein